MGEEKSAGGKSPSRSWFSNGNEPKRKSAAHCFFRWKHGRSVRMEQYISIFDTVHLLSDIDQDEDSMLKRDNVLGKVRGKIPYITWYLGGFIHIKVQ